MKVFTRVVLFAVMALAITSALYGQVRISVTFAPPALPVYEQPLCPGEGYIWTPGYWDWSEEDGDYYWVPGTWVEAPEVGYLWTPPYWGWEGGVFLFHEGYWGPHVGFYGGINYGFGYFGDGFAGGRWDGGHFFYNREVTNVNVTVIHNVYTQTVVNKTVVNRVSFNGGNGGVQARPSREQEEASRERHLPPAAPQQQQVRVARGNPELRAAANHGKPPVAATAKPGELKGGDVRPAREAGGTYNPPPNKGGARPENNNRPEERNANKPGNNPAANNNNEARPGGNPVHPKDLPPMERPSAPNTGNQKQDQKYQQQEEKLQQRQEQQRQKLQQKQDKEDQKMSQQKADDPRKQQVEQRHAQQTQQMQQKHTQQQQTLQHRQQPAPRSEPKPDKPPKN